MDFEEEWEFWHSLALEMLYETPPLSLFLGKVFGEWRHLGEFLFLFRLQLGVRYSLVIIWGVGGVWFCWLVLHVSLLWGDCGSFVDSLWEGTTIMVFRLSIFWGALGLTKNGAWSSFWLEELDENSSRDQLLASFSGFWFDCSRAWRLTSCNSIPLFISSFFFVIWFLFFSFFFMYFLTTLCFSSIL